MTMQLRPPRPASQHVSDRDNIILKSVMHELALALDEPLISTAHAAGTDRQAVRPPASSKPAPLNVPRHNPAHRQYLPASPPGSNTTGPSNDQFNHGPWGPLFAA